MQFEDKQNSYGWISILLHWFAAGVVLTLWFMGDSASVQENPLEKLNQTKNHISIALLVYLILLVRIGWRLKSGHPKLDNQGYVDHIIAKIAHYVLLLAIATMLISGPLIVWSNGQDLYLFDWFRILNPIGRDNNILAVCKSAHRYGGMAIIAVTLLHTAGALKHLMFNNDEVFLRIFTPKS